jgi:hypothetical protein
MYQTPELLLVGAAQHLVLGDSIITTDTAGSACPNLDERDGANYWDVVGW